MVDQLSQPYRRRELLLHSGVILTGAAWIHGLETPKSAWAGEESANQPEHKEEEISPAEDLMREHGVLNRVLLIYEELQRRVRSGSDFPPTVLQNSAKIIRSFIEDYHEKLEEDYLFPRFEKAGKLLDLVKVLREQHQAGRVLTDAVLNLSSEAALKEEEKRNQLVQQLRRFIRMYRPHESREDTVLFPALRSLVSPNEYAALGEEFEDKEHDLFGEDGFDSIVAQVAGLEKEIGLDDLAKFTPQM